MREKGIERGKAMDSVRLQRLIDLCDTKESTALYLLEDWNYEPQVIRGDLLHVSVLKPQVVSILSSPRSLITSTPKCSLIIFTVSKQ